VADEPRLQRLRAAVLAVPPEMLRKAIRRISEDIVRALPGPARPLMNQLRRSKEPAVLLTRVPNMQVVAVIADHLADETLEVCRTFLGESADDPTREQVLEALDKLLQLFDVAEVRVMLATVAIADAAASDLCDDLLREDERFALP
jgi:hypothetical protein